VVAQARATGTTPTIDVGLVAALRAGTVTPVAGLPFVGMTNPLTGALFQIGREARAVARAIAGELSVRWDQLL